MKVTLAIFISLVFSMTALAAPDYALRKKIRKFDPEKIKLRITKKDLYKDIIGISDITPWSGSWFPIHNNKMIWGVLKDHKRFPKSSDNYTLTPFEKYGLYLEKKYGNQIKFGTKEIVDWEELQHTYKFKPKKKPFFTIFDWKGHCDGLASAAILAKEPKRSVTKQGITFTVGDLKALLVESHIEVLFKSYGKPYKRQRKKKKSSPLHRLFHDPVDREKRYKDVDPVVFHKALRYYIGELKYPVVFDFETNEKVHNHPVFQFVMYIVPSGIVYIHKNGYFKKRKTYEVTVDTVYADYADEDFIGTKRKVYSFYYKLYTNSKGKVLYGKWDHRRLVDGMVELKRQAQLENGYIRSPINRDHFCEKNRRMRYCERKRKKEVTSRHFHPDVVWIPYRSIDPFKLDKNAMQNIYIENRFVNEILEGSQ